MNNIKIATVVAIVILVTVALGCIPSSVDADELDLSPVDLNQDYLDTIGVESSGRYTLSGGCAYALTDNLNLGSSFLYFAGDGSLDLAGYSITSTSNYAMVVATLDGDGQFSVNDSEGNGTVSGATAGVNVTSELTISGGKFIGLYGAYVSGNSGDLTVNGGILEGSEYGIYQTVGICTVEGGVVSGSTAGIRCVVLDGYKEDSYVSPYLEINGGTVTGNTGIQIGGRTIGSNAFVSTLYITDGTVTGNNGSAISGNGSWDNTYITIENGTFSAKNSAVVYHPQEGSLTINGGEFTSDCSGIQFCGPGKLVINNAEITVTEFFNEPTKPDEQDDGTVDDGAAVSIINRGSAYLGTGMMEVTIRGGTFSTQGSPVIQSYWFAMENGSWTDEPEIEVTRSGLSSLNVAGGKFTSTGTSTMGIRADDQEAVKIIGGTFQSSDSTDTSVSALLEDTSYTLSSDGKVVLADEVNAVASIGDARYETLADAISAATDGSDIVLLVGVSEAVEFDTNITVTLNLNGYNMTSSGNTITVSNGTTLIITGTGTIDSGNHDDVNIRSIVNNGGTIIFDKDSDVTCLDEVLNDQNGTINIYGTVDTGSDDISNRFGSTLNVHGTIYGGVANFGTTMLYDGCNIYLANLRNTSSGGETTGQFVLSEDCNNTHNILVSHQDEIDTGGNAILKSFNGRGHVIQQGQSVVVTVEGSDDPNDPYVYSLDNNGDSTIFSGSDLTIKVKEGTYATIRLGSGNVTIASSGATEDNHVDISFVRLTFTTSDGYDNAQLRVSNFFDTTFTDCTFNNVWLPTSGTIGADGTYAVTGCTFTLVDSSYNSYAVNLSKANVVFRDNTVSGYQRGLCINTRDGGDESVTISDNTFYGINDESGGYAIQLTFESAGTKVAITDNTIDNCLYALRVHENGDDTKTPESVTFMENTITETPNGILYSANGEDDSIRSDVSIYADLNYFSPDGRGGIAIPVTTDSQTASTGELVTCDEWYTEPTKTYTNLEGLAAPSVSISVSDRNPFYGETVRLTATVSNPVEGATYTYRWSNGSDLSYTDVRSGGTYTVTVTVTYGGLSEAGTASTSVSFLWPGAGGSDDEDVVLPPQIVYEDSGSDDDVVKVAACAAAAVAAAIIALILVAEYRKK